MGLRLMQLKQQGEIARGNQDVQRERNKVSSRTNELEQRKLDEMYGTPGKRGTVHRQLDISKQQADIESAKIHNALKPVDAKNWFFANSRVMRTIKDISPKTAKAIEPIMGDMEVLVNSKATPLQLKSHFSRNWKNEILIAMELL